MKTSKFIESIAPYLPRKFNYFDIGARGGIQYPWTNFNSLLNIFYFEADQSECNNLNANKNENAKVLNYALSSKSVIQDFNLTISPGCSSFYLPNIDLLKNFPEWERFNIDDTEKITTITLDQLHQKQLLKNVDFLKIDTQGSEFDILNGGKELLQREVLGVEVEVEFHELYIGQPLFSDIDSFLRGSKSFELQDLRKTYWKYSKGIGYGPVKGKLIFGDALYFRSPQSLFDLCNNYDSHEAAAKIIMACIMSIAYGYFDYALLILDSPEVERYINPAAIKELGRIIKKFCKTKYFNGKFFSMLSFFFYYLHRIFLPNHNGWASIGQNLGSARKKGFFV